MAKNVLSKLNDFDYLLNKDNSILNSINLDGLESPAKQLINTQTNEHANCLSNNKYRRGVRPRIAVKNSQSTPKDVTKLNESSKRVNDSNNHSYQNKKIKTNAEFDAFKNYYSNNSQLSSNKSLTNNDSDENLNETMTRLSQFFKNSQVLKQIDSVILQENQTFKKPTVLNETNQSTTINDAENDDNSFNNITHQGVDKFFNQIQHSISMMGNDSIKVSERVFDALFNESYNKDNLESSQSLIANIDWSDDPSFNASFGTVIKQALLANASKTQQILNSPIRRTSNGYANQNTSRVVFRNMGPFYGLPTKVKELIKLYKGINELYDWQDECLKLEAIKQRNNLIYALPTSGGKTLVAEILMLREIICYKRNALFILPYVAIVQEKVWGLSPFAVALDFLVEEYAASKGLYPPRKRRKKNSIYIATIEKALGLINSLIENERLNELGLIVVDEIHLVGEQGRGATLEALLTKLMYLNSNIQIVGMSATIGNIKDLCTFLKADIYSQNFRPIELIEYVKCGTEIAKINSTNDEDELFTVVRKTDFEYSDAVSSLDPDRIGGLVMEVIPKDSCLIFCASKKNCENVASLLCRVLDKKLANYKNSEKERIIHELKDETGSLCKILNVSIHFGIAYHHSGLTNEERRIIEDGFRAGIISVICCTSTLAAGVNLPAKRVILRQPYIGRDFISLSKYKQMIGRAGRAGLGETGDSILICSSQDLIKVKKLLLSPMDQALSNLHENDGKGLRHLLLSCISLGIANNRIELQNVTKKTLLAVQNLQLEVNVKKLTDKTISDLFKLGALQEADLNKSEYDSDVSVRLEASTSSNNSTLNESNNGAINSNGKKRIVVKNNTKLVISKLGCAAIKGNFELTRAHMLYDDLYEAQKNLVLISPLHLLYLLTPYEISEQFHPNKNDYYNIFCKLGENELHTAKILGLNEAVAIKMLCNQEIKTISERALNRFYLALVLYDLWNEMPVFEASEKYQISRGIVQTLMTSAATFSSNIVNFCEGLEEFWSFAYLIKGMNQRLSHCCVKELIPLMELPAVKQSRAKQLYNAGYKTLQSIAKTNADNLIENIEFMSRRVANQLIAAAKMLLLEKVENLREEAEDVLDGVENKPLLNQTMFH